MGDLTEHFSRKEFKCKCGCESDNINMFHVERMELFRGFLSERLGEEHKIIIHSGVRCLAYNTHIGSKPTSQHTWDPDSNDGRPCACDFHVERVRDGHRKDTGLVYWAAIDLGEFGGLGLYKSFVHADSRLGRKARWRNY